MYEVCIKRNEKDEVVENEYHVKHIILMTDILHYLLIHSYAFGKPTKDSTIILVNHLCPNQYRKFKEEICPKNVPVLDYESLLTDDSIRRNLPCFLLRVGMIKLERRERSRSVGVVLHNAKNVSTILKKLKSITGNNKPSTVVFRDTVPKLPWHESMLLKLKHRYCRYTKSPV